MKNKKKKRQIIGRKYNKLGSLWWAVKKHWQLDRRFVLLVVSSVPTAVALPLTQSYFSKTLIDSIGAGVQLLHLVLICVFFSAAVMALRLLRSYQQLRCTARQYRLTMVVQNELSRLLHYDTDYENVETQDYKELKGYAFRDSSCGDCSMEWVWEDIVKAMTNACGIVTCGSLLAFIDPAMFVVVAVVSMLSYFTTRWQSMYTEKHKHEWEKEARKVDYLQELSENFPIAKDIKLYGLEGWLEQLLRHYQDYVFLWNKRCMLRGMWAAVLAAVMTLIQDGAAYFYLIALLLNGGISVGDFVFYFGVVSSIATYLSGIISDIATLNSRAEKIAYYRNVYDYPNRFNHSEGCPLPNEAVKIELRDVWYRYDGAEDYTIKGLNLTIDSGEDIALVGLNGAGKTTLVKLICGFYAPTRGEILINGRQIREYNIEEYYSLISAVFQTVSVIAVTVWEFVASADMVRSNAREDAVAALKAAGVWDKIASLPHGIDTHLMKNVYDDGIELSGGEMQKLLLARAIYKDAPILILDEPTAALDPIAENNLYLQYRELTNGKTSLYISHRFASTRFCDRIVLLEDGVIAEIGTHDELMAQNGRYAYMFGVQSKYYKEGESHA